MSRVGEDLIKEGAASPTSKGTAEKEATDGTGDPRSDDQGLGYVALGCFGGGRKSRDEDRDIGDVIVLEDENVAGILTDRDIVIRAIAEGRSPADTTIGEIASRDLALVSPDDTVETVIGIMRAQALRRVPVVEAGKPIGIVSIGDLAIERDNDSALADISAAEPNE